MYMELSGWLHAPAERGPGDSVYYRAALDAVDKGKIFLPSENKSRPSRPQPIAILRYSKCESAGTEEVHDSA
jgi:hypothetical protein